MRTTDALGQLVTLAGGALSGKQGATRTAHQT